MTQTISVAMATYNGAPFIEGQLESIAAQTLAPAELVICDDGSTDDTIATIEAFAARCPFPVRLVRNEVNLGYVDNFLKAASLCSSDLVALSDQDDVWDVRKLELCAPAFLDPSVMLCYHGIKVVDRQLNPLYDFDLVNSRSGRHAPSTMWPGRYPWGLAQIFRRDLLAITEGMRRPLGYHSVKRIGHDEWIAFIADVFGATYAVNEHLVLYRQHGNNASGGGRPTGSLIAQVRRQDSDILKNIAASLDDQAAVLREFLPRCATAYRERVSVAIGRKQQLSDLFRRRWQLYSSESRIRRLGQFVDLLRHRSYGRGGSNRLPYRAFVRDTLFVLLGPEQTREVSAAGPGPA